MADAPHDPHETAALCYGMAYYVLPHYVFENVEAATEQLLLQGGLGAAFFYAITCKSQGKPPSLDVCRSFAARSGSLDGDWDYCVVQYPSPPPAVDLFSEEGLKRLGANPNFVLAPHFSAILRGKASGEVRYFVLGQSTDGRTTTLRRVTPDGTNANRGRGCHPDPDAFVELLRRTVRSERTSAGP